jgi:hypothetical protein
MERCTSNALEQVHSVLLHPEMIKKSFYLDEIIDMLVQILNEIRSHCQNIIDDDNSNSTESRISFEMIYYISQF